MTKNFSKSIRRIVRIKLKLFSDAGQARSVVYQDFCDKIYVYVYL